MFPQNRLILDFSVTRLFQRESQTQVLVVATLPPLSTAPVTLCYSHTLGRAADLLISSPGFLSYHPALQARLTRERSLQCQVWQLAAQGTATGIWLLAVNGTATDTWLLAAEGTATDTWQLGTASGPAVRSSGLSSTTTAQPWSCICVVRAPRQSLVISLLAPRIRIPRAIRARAQAAHANDGFPEHSSTARHAPLQQNRGNKPWYPNIVTNFTSILHK